MRTFRFIVFFALVVFIGSILQQTPISKAINLNSPLQQISNMESGWIEEYRANHTIYSSNDYVEGRGSLQLITGYDSGFSGAYLDIDSTNFTSCGFRMFIRCSDWSRVQYFTLNLSPYKDWHDFFWVELKNVLNAPPNGEWIEIVLSRSNFYTVGNPSWSSISRIQILAGTNAYKPVTVGVDDLSYFQNNRQASVSITFDDGQECVYTVAKPLLDAYNYKATLFSITDYVGEPGFLSQFEMEELNIAGWDIGGHSDLVLTQITDEELDKDLLATKNYLASRNYKGSDMYALPYGLYNENVFKKVRNYFNWIRPDDSLYQPGGYISNNRINSQVVVPSSMPVSTVINWVDNALKNRDSLVLVFHKIVDNPQVDSEYSTEHFKEILDYMNARNIPVIPLSQLVNGTD